MFKQKRSGRLSTTIGAGRKNIINKILFNQITLAIIGLLIILAISFPLARNISKQYKANKEVNDLEKEIADLESKDFKLKNLIKYIESDQFIQEQARLNLNYKTEGEEVVVIKEKDEQINSEDKIDNHRNPIYDIRGLNKAKDKEKINNPARWWNYFSQK